MQSKTMRLDRLPPGAIEEATRILKYWTQTTGRYNHHEAWLIRDVIEHLLRPALEQHAALAAAGLLIQPSSATNKKRSTSNQAPPEQRKT